MLTTWLPALLISQIGFQLANPTVPVQRVAFGTTQLPLQDESLEIVVDGQHATTTMEHIYRNETRGRLEGVFELRTPPGTEVEGFSYWNGEQRIVGEVFEKEAARRVYEGVRAQRRDPGLLERIDEGLFRFRVFPIEPGERKRVQVRYSRWLAVHEDEIEYRALLTDANAHVTIRTTGMQDFPELYSPTHRLHIETLGEGAFHIAAEPKERGDELALRWQATSSQWRLRASVHQGDDENGFLNIAISAPRGAVTAQAGRNITLLLDRSGSMAGEPFRRAKDAALAMLMLLQPADRFNIIFFDDNADPLFSGLEDTSAANLQRAREYLVRTRTGGGTNIANALAAALAAQNADEHRNLVLLLTDGRSDARAALDAAKNDTTDTRIFTVGLGNEVSKSMLTRLAALKGGRFLFVDRTEELETQMLRVFTSLSAPLWSDTEIVVNDAPMRQAYPRHLTDIFPGGELHVTGRFDPAEQVDILVRGRVGGELQELRTSISATATGDGTWVARLWARNHVNALMEEEAEYGADAERTNEYIALAVAYNFVTPHTAFLAIPASEVTANVRLTLDQVLAHKKAVLQEHREAAALLNPEDVADADMQGFPALGAIGLDSGGAMLGGGGGSLSGTVVGTVGGAGGLGTRGTSPGGGGSSGDIGGLGSVNFGGKTDSHRVRVGQVVVAGNSKEVVAKVLAQARNQVRYCYEKELQRKPDLRGKVTLTFVINGEGVVIDVKITQSTLGDNGKAVCACVERIVRGLRFPRPAGGGATTVTYPWIFDSM